MNVGLPEVKQDFASIVERITLQPWTMLQFIIWLDLKLAEYKVNGYMVLDQSLSSIPDWLASLNIDQSEEATSPSESVPLQEQFMQPTNTSWRDSSVQSNTYRRELSTQSSIIHREVRTQKTFGDRRRDMVTRNQPVSARNQPVPVRNQPVPARNQPVPARNQPVPARNQPAPARNQPAPARNQPAPARNQTVPTRNDAISPRQFPSASPQERRAAGYQRSSSPITIDDEDVIVPEHDQTLQQEQENVMHPGRSGMKRAAMQQPPNAPRHDTDIKHQKVTDTSSPVASARSPSSANIPRGDFGSDNSHNIQETQPSSEEVLSRTVNRPSPSAVQSPTQPVQSEQQPQSDSDTTLQDSSLSLDIKPIVSETLDDIISPEATDQPQPDSAPLVDINFEMQEFLPAHSFGDELFDSTSSEPVPTQLFVNTVEARKTATATSTSATGSSSSSNQPDPVAGTSYGTRSQLDIDFDDSGDAQVKMEPGEAEPDDTEEDCLSCIVIDDESTAPIEKAQTLSLCTKDSAQVWPFLNRSSNKKQSNFFKICCYCDKELTDARELIPHRAFCNRRSFQCGICGKTYKSGTSRDYHKGKVHGISKFQCPKCRKKIFSKQQYEDHMNHHYKSGLYRCDKCHAKYSYKYRLAEHKKKMCPFRNIETE